MVSELVIISVTLFSALVASFAQYIFKKAIPKFNFRMKELLALRKNEMLVFGLLVYIADLGIYLYALKYGQLSFVYPVFASSFIFTLLISMYALGEKVGTKRIAGIIFIIIGIALVALTY